MNSPGWAVQADAVDGANRPVALDDVVQQQRWRGLVFIVRTMLFDRGSFQ